MSRYRLSPRARVDLDGIWAYTADTWDEDQAELYVRSIRTAIEIVSQCPGLGRSCDEIRAGYRRYRVGSHILFYRVGEGEIEIVRILHARMDVEQHV